MLKYLEFSASEREINVELRAIAFIYFLEITKLKLDLPGRVNVQIVKTQEDEFWVTPLHLSKTNITVNCKHDITNYMKLSRTNKIKLQAEIIHNALQFLFSKLNLDFSQIVYLKDKIVVSNLQDGFDLRLKKSVKKVDYDALVIIKPDFEFFSFYLKVKTQTEELEYLLFKGHTAYVFAYHTLFHSILCETGIVKIRSKRKEVTFECNLLKPGVCDIKCKDPENEKILDSRRYNESYEFISYFPVSF